MNIWKLKFLVDKFDNFILERPFSLVEIQAFDGRSHIDDWRPLVVKRMEPEKKLDLGDAPGFNIPVLSKKALDCLLPLIKENTEILPLIFDENDFFALNITTVLDAVNYSESVYKTFRDGKRIMAFEKYSFIPEKVSGIPMFKIIDEKTRYGFVSDEIKRIVEDNNLNGFDFELVWKMGN